MVMCEASPMWWQMLVITEVAVAEPATISERGSVLEH